ncbi:hypothetical protein LIER_28875 [Lithospermum erythrorhizon]|uniref:Uncharacterized protein n=1 Tax=Lithospermum erythrorhizon TaxID=34254 RepID=A0AAV3RKL1_LITER
MAQPKKVLPPENKFQRMFLPFLQAATTPQALTEYGAAKEDEVDRLEVAIVREDSRVYPLRESVEELETQLSLASQELRRSAVYAQ